MIPISIEQIDRFVAACHKVGRYGLMSCSSGNMSWRIDDERMLVSASRSWMAELTSEQVTEVRIADGAVLAGPKPSVETVFHAGILRNRPEAGVVLHFQTPFATTLACREPAGVNYFVIPEIPYYIGPVGVVPFLMPGSAELAEATIETMTNHDMGVLTNHGLVTLGDDFDDAIQKAVFFELACEIIVRGGTSARPLSDETVDQLRKAAAGEGFGAA